MRKCHMKIAKATFNNVFYDRRQKKVLLPLFKAWEKRDEIIVLIHFKYSWLLNTIYQLKAYTSISLYVYSDL